MACAQATGARRLCTRTPVPPSSRLRAASDARAVRALGAASSGDRATAGAAPPAAGDAAQRPLAPWTLTFDLRERDTLWSETNQARLVRIVAGYQLGKDVQEVERRLAELSSLLPDVAARCAYIRPSTLAKLLRDPAVLVARLLMLRQLLPDVDLPKLAAAEPELLLLRDVGAVQSDLLALEQLVGDAADVTSLIQRHPRFLDAALVRDVLGELRRLMPHADPVATLVADPRWILRVERGRQQLGDDPD